MQGKDMVKTQQNRSAKTPLYCCMRYNSKCIE
jgi:hypothetical protein